MADIVNLRNVRKRAKRRQAAENAAAQRVAYGTPKALREEIAARRDQTERKLDAHRLTKRDE